MRRITLSLTILMLCALLATTAWAITYGQPDGQRHPHVGALVGQFSSGQFPYCSGTLISPTVFLTAAHCDIGTSTVFVTFDTEYSSRSKLHSGTFFADPQFNWKQDDPHDIAVVVFDRPVKGITPARLPAAGSLDNLPHDQAFTVVGYGGQEPVNQPGGPVIGFLDTREFSTATLNSINPAWLRLSQNPATGDSGACYGDSGGPNFLGTTNIVAATTITGDALCKATNVVYRTDTESARNFLRNFVALP
ncbi:MAG TPA: trypsin-like serine protease [Pyrinomonadaceae bacterium]|nr:trypsin-like serine protease [Pyrinomonadaceae bacterium]